MSKKNSITIDRTAIYHTLGNPKTAKTIWFVLHGYGMLAEFFIKKFEPILNENTCIVAPEGLSKLYTKGFYGRVGASWMTKQDRELEIEDYINYLNKLYTTILNESETDNPKINLLGFSQGGATVSRWVANKQINFENLILWASAFPDDMDFSTIASNNTYVLYGNDDEFASDKNILKQKELLDKSRIDYQIISFEGTHDIPKDVLVNQSEINNW